MSNTTITTEITKQLKELKKVLDAEKQDQHALLVKELIIIRNDIIKLNKDVASLKSDLDESKKLSSSTISNMQRDVSTLKSNQKDPSKEMQLALSSTESKIYNKLSKDLNDNVMPKLESMGRFIAMQIGDTQDLIHADRMRSQCPEMNDLGIKSDYKPLDRHFDLMNGQDFITNDTWQARADTNRTIGFKRGA
jgi:hypothetical protein